MSAPGWATVFCLQLGDNGDPPYGGVGINPHRFSTVRFVLHAGSPICLKKPKLTTNYPVTGKPFSRDVWYDVPAKYVRKQVLSLLHFQRIPRGHGVVR